MSKKSSSEAGSQTSSKRVVGRRRERKGAGAGLARLDALANLAHELRTPLQVLLGYLEILRDDWADGFAPEPREMLERMNHNLHDLSHTVDNIMEFVLAEAGGMIWVQEEVSLSGLVNDLAPAIEAARSNKELALRFDLGDAPQTVHVPRRPLRSILSNLVLNAIKFTERGGVTVRIGRMREHGAEDGLEIEVSDTGQGINPAMIKLVAEPFAQLSHSNSRIYRGLGLGLAVVHRNARLLGARLEVSSAPGQGSRFVVRIPPARLVSSSAANRRKGQRLPVRADPSAGTIATQPRRTMEAEAFTPVVFV
jgi:signal transduction histidine kinase